VTNNDIREDVTELLRNGIKIVVRDERHTPEGAAMLERVLNKLLRHFGRSCTVTLDHLAMVITLVAKEK
jgi:hypothetical protein